MHLFECESCGAVLFFENARCESCGATLGYDPELGVLRAVAPLLDSAGQQTAQWRSIATSPQAKTYRLCKNSTDHQACNWLVTPSDPTAFCKACQLNEVIPDIKDESAKSNWRRLESAKRRLLHSLYALGLPVEPRDSTNGGLAFRFLKSTPAEPIVTGHNEGVITLNVAEADGAFREHARDRLGEAYRTVLGHFRHEIGHYYWDKLVRDTRFLSEFREVFGDERLDYQQALERHYESGPPPDWQQGYISAYATMHPWEDWAETWAHYMHMVCTLSTARSHGVTVHKLSSDAQGQPSNVREVDFNDFDDVLEAWVPVTLALNSMSRSMGKEDLYPFAASEAATRKLRFVHRVIRAASAERTVAVGGASSRPREAVSLDA